MLELTAAQQDIYLEGKLFGRVLNNIGGYERLPGAIDVDRFSQARSFVLRENDAYSLRFHDGDGKCIPFIRDGSMDDLCVIDMSTPDQALSWMQETFELPFADISSDVFEDALIRLPSGEYWYYAKAHHLIMDGWGFALQMRRILGMYERLAANDAYMATPQPSFVDYMRRQVGYVTSEQYDRSRDYWMRRHEGSPGPLFLPMDVGSESGSGRVSTVLEAELMDGLIAAATRAGANLVALVYSTLYLYFSRAHQRNDITICSPEHNRRNAIDKETIGSMVNVCAHRLTADIEITFHELMKVIASTQRQDMRHGRFPLGDLIRAKRAESEGDANPLFEISFNYQKLDFQISIHDEVVETHYLSHSNERLPLTFVLCDYGRAQEVRLHLDYARNYFNESAAEAILERIQFILRQVVKDDGLPIFEYDLTTPDEWQRQLVSANGPVLPLRSDARLHDFFQDQVNRTPDAIAITSGDAFLTYAELDDRANCLTRQLVDSGVTTGQLIGICHSRSNDLLVALLATMKAGAAYVPVDPAYPSARVRYILNDSCVELVIADASGVQALEGIETRVIRTDADSSFSESFAWNGDRHLSEATADDLAYVIYTSGSTGEPKGVQIEHRNAAAFVEWALSQFTHDELSHVLAGTSICFDLSIFELFVPLAAGGSVRIAENVLALQAEDMSGISLINTVPSAIRGLLNASIIPSSVRCINLAGEPLRQDIVDALYDRHAAIKVYDLYGPSETTTYSTVCLREPGGEATIGTPIANTQVYIFDERGNPLPTGATGELYIGGAGLSRGYLNRTSETEKKFAINPRTASRLYRTGDLVKLTSNGRLRYVGRKDGQEKIRGYRVETGEVESCLLGHPSINDCAVIARALAASPDHKVLVAYVVKMEGQGISDASLAGFLGERLPSFMIPSHFVWLDALPLTPNGKLDRRTLPLPDTDLPKDALFVDPTNDMERRLLSLWTSILKQDRIGIRDSFFSRGGDSLLLLKLAASIESEFDVHVDMSHLFESHSIETQARLLSGQLDLHRLLRSVSIDDEPASAGFVAL
ncbi:MAG: amino acid adenylation domain-containing protein [Luteibacter sp.]